MYSHSVRDVYSVEVFWIGAVHN